MIGSFVSSRAGRDKGYLMVVVGKDGERLLVCDGKERPLENPKAKNPKHLVFTGASLEESSYKTNKALRRAIAIAKHSGAEE